MSEVQNENIEESKEEKSSISPVEEAKEILAKISEQNQLLEKNLKKAEEIQINEILSGKGTAGDPPKEDKNAGAKALIAGTGFEEELFPEK